MWFIKQNLSLIHAKYPNYYWYEKEFDTLYPKLISLSPELFKLNYEITANSNISLLHNGLIKFFSKFRRLEIGVNLREDDVGKNLFNLNLFAEGARFFWTSESRPEVIAHVIISWLIDLKSPNQIKDLIGIDGIHRFSDIYEGKITAAEEFSRNWGYMEAILSYLNDEFPESDYSSCLTIFKTIRRMGYEKKLNVYIQPGFEYIPECFELSKSVYQRTGIGEPYLHFGPCGEAEVTKVRLLYNEKTDLVDYSVNGIPKIKNEIYILGSQVTVELKEMLDLVVEGKPW
jgi:hypothetical protein